MAKLLQKPVFALPGCQPISAFALPIHNPTCVQSHIWGVPKLGLENTNCCRESPAEG